MLLEPKQVWEHTILSQEQTLEGVCIRRPHTHTLSVEASPAQEAGVPTL